MNHWTHNCVFETASLFQRARKSSLFFLLLSMPTSAFYSSVQLQSSVVSKWVSLISMSPGSKFSSTKGIEMYTAPVFPLHASIIWCNFQPFLSDSHKLYMLSTQSFKISRDSMTQNFMYFYSLLIHSWYLSSFCTSTNCKEYIRSVVLLDTVLDLLSASSFIPKCSYASRWFILDLTLACGKWTEEEEWINDPKRDTIQNLVFTVCLHGNRMSQMKINLAYKISQNVILKAASSVKHVWEADLFSHVCFKSLVFFVPHRKMKKEKCNAYWMRLKRSKYCWTP